MPFITNTTSSSFLLNTDVAVSSIDAGMFMAAGIWHFFNTPLHCGYQ
jgi:hypothetical protein